MRHKKRLIVLFVMLALVILLEYILPYSPHTVAIYASYIFRPFQTMRNFLFGALPVSIGDLLYVAGGIILTVLLVRWVRYIIKAKTYGHRLLGSVINTLSVFAVVYILFFIGWGGNYYKPTLSEHWQLDTSIGKTDTSLVEFDKFLISRLNSYAPHYKDLSFKEVGKRSKQFYKTYTDNESNMHGLKAKPSIFGNTMEYFGIQGYYNPFTGEAQVNGRLPAFMLPFVVCHELAHQSGIAAEDDANLLAYAVGTEVNDASFRYSCYFNIWLYTNGRLRSIDSARARSLQNELNPLSVAHIATLRALRKKYRSIFSKFSGVLYDNYLRMHNQEQGLETYDNVASSAWAWEQKRDALKGKLISIP